MTLQRFLLIGLLTSPVFFWSYAQGLQAAPQAHQDRGLTNSAARMADALERVADALEHLNRKLP